MIATGIVFALCFALLVSADVTPLVPLEAARVLKSREIPFSSTYSSSVIQAVTNDGQGLSYSTLQTHNPVLEARLIQPVIRYNVGSINLPFPNIGLFVQNPALVSGLVPVQQIEPIANPGSSAVLQTVPTLPVDSTSNSDDSVTIEAN